jgi:hypothetical protein
MQPGVRVPLNRRALVQREHAETGLSWPGERHMGRRLHQLLLPALILVAAACGVVGPGGNEGSQPGQCSDQVDNDGDGQVDCLDSDCAGAPVCAGTGDDDDGVGDDDSAPADDDSASDDDDDSGGGIGDDDDDDDTPPCGEVQPLEMTCDDGCDNDGNGLTDCDDLVACLADPVCGGGDDDSGGPQSGPCFDMPCCCEPDVATGKPTCPTCLEQMGPPPVGCGADPTGWSPDGHLLEEGNTVCCGFGSPAACEECEDGIDNDLDGLIDELDDSCDDWFSFLGGGGVPR